MAKTPLIVVSIAVAFFIVLASCTNVIGVQTDTSSNQKKIKDNLNQKELFYLTILEIVNNKEIQNIIQNSNKNEGLLRFSQAASAKPLLINLQTRLNAQTSSLPIFMKIYFDYAYNMGLILTKTIRIPKNHPLFSQYRVNNQEMQDKITAVIESNDELNSRIEQLSELSCGCENDNTAIWNFPILCTVLYFLLFLSMAYFFLTGDISPAFTIGLIGGIFNCDW